MVDKERKVKERPRTLTTDERVELLEERVKKQARWTILATLIAAILGSGGAAGLISSIGDRQLREAETRLANADASSKELLKRADVRLQQAEAESKELDVACKRHDQSIGRLHTILDSFMHSGDRRKAETVRRIILQQEIGFQDLLKTMSQCFSVMSMISPSADRWSRQARDQIGRASEHSGERKALLSALLDK